MKELSKRSIKRMPEREKIVAGNGIILWVCRSVAEGRVDLTLEMETYRKCFLHWGCVREPRAAWMVPPESVWPEDSHAFDHSAVRSPFVPQGGLGRITFRLSGASEYSQIEFVLFYPDEHRWDDNAGHNYLIDGSGGGDMQPVVSPMKLLRKDMEGVKVLFENEVQVQSAGTLAIGTGKVENVYRLLLVTNIQGPLVLHWGVTRRSPYEWLLPPSSLFPPGTIIIQNKAAQTPFRERNGLRRLQIDFEEKDAPRFVAFVLFQPESGRWLKDAGSNFFVPIGPPPVQDESPGDGEVDGIAREIIGKEMSGNSWTLMHRFNLCFDLLDKAENSPDGLALVFVWLRFSALRQLDWQRNYNTKPGELGHSLDRLTQKLSGVYVRRPGDRGIIRLILSTLGRGTDAQRVRDEVLNIMHRHQIKEVSGHFMEEWHQKLHNNTTYDDVVICEAYLEFLRSNGDLRRFYRRLEEDGVTKERLEGFERPIRSHPDFVPHLKYALIREFEHFLGILKEVHSGTDLGTAIKNARHALDGELHGLMDFVWHHRDDHGEAVKVLAEKITVARQRLAPRLEHGEASTRDLLFLDLVLENFLRLALERNFQSGGSDDALVGLINAVLENLSLSQSDPEFARCLYQWQRLATMPRFGREWSLLAKSVLDRLQRALGEFVDRSHQLLQPKAEFLGGAFHAAEWSITLFSEDVIRARNEFVLSILIGKLDPVLRKTAQLGDWQIISVGQGRGFVHKVEALKSIQGTSFTEPAVVVADTVAGNEEMPQNVVAVLTPDTTDIVSHIAIRARNAHVLFATCYDPSIYNRLKSLDGQYVGVEINAQGEVLVEKSGVKNGPAPAPRPRARIAIQRPRFTGFAVSSGGFSNRIVGGKSSNLRRYQGKLPDWMHIPVSVALPFMVFERVLEAPGNSRVAKKHAEMSRGIGKLAGAELESMLAELRQNVRALTAPDELISSLRDTMQDAGLPFPASWEDAWGCITGVWASKWNDRAYLSRKTMGIPDDDLVMAVLIQQVVEADYSFVIHTTNPLTGKANETYAEIVLGLGETLVGNYPGRAFSFVCEKGKKNPRILGFPSKSDALHGNGLIYRSDSNGEDLVGYAGAGLYDSVMLPSPHRVTLDYANEPLVWDEAFQKDLMEHITIIGESIEQVAKTPQDIEGAYSKGEYYVVQTRPQVGIGNG